MAEIYEDELIEFLLNYDLEKFAWNLKLINREPKQLSAEKATQLLNLAERYSRAYNDEGKQNKCLYICGLLWEHKNSDWKAVDAFLVQLLTRLGLGPSAIMADTSYQDKFSSLGSLQSELRVTSILNKYEVNVTSKDTILLSAFQKRMWDAMDKYNRLGISAPTSAGKSFVLVYKIAQLMLTKPGTFVYIVPTISLVNQVSKDIRSTLKKFSIKATVLTSYTPEDNHSEKHRIYVLTQERALSMVIQQENKLDDIELLVVDEIQNIERTADVNDERAHILLDVINEFHNSLKPQKIVVCGPRLRNISEVVKELFGEDAKGISENLPPVVNITYSFSSNKKKVFIKQYSTIRKEPLKLKVDNNDMITGFGKSRYDEDMYSFLANLVENLNQDSGTIIFSPTHTQATNTAKEIANRIIPLSNNSNLDSLKAYIKDTVHENYSLIKTIDCGIAYHHGKMPLHIRMAVEDAFSSGVVKNVACTTTLMQGVNLPAKNLIARNPNLFLKKNKESGQLTSYEFANLRGRAGRLMKDFVGRAIILDEDAFGNTNDYLNKFTEKELTPGYADRFNDNEDEILISLMEGYEVEENNNFNDLTVYIRQIILKYGQSALKVMKNVGIDIDHGQFKHIYVEMQNLKIPKEICIMNRYWDPLALERLYLQRWVKIANNPFDANFTKSLYENIVKLRNLIPFYYNKYFGEYNEKRIFSIILYLQSWSQENALKSILQNAIKRDYENIDKIDEIIDTLNKASFSIPKLIKPLVDMQDSENPILSCIETGTFHPLSRRLMDFGIPRETAIKIRKITQHRVENANQLNSQLAIRVAYNRLNYWEKKQVGEIM